MSLAVGTSHFVTRDAALDYYCGKVKKVRTRDRQGDFYGPYYWKEVRSGGYGCTPADVDYKITEGEISIGEPTVPAGARLSIIADEGRYQYHPGVAPAPAPIPEIIDIKPNLAERAADLANASAMLTKAESAMSRKAQIYARQAVLEYAAAHPRRKVLFCAAMGHTTFSVSHRGRLAENNDIEFDGQSADTTARGYVGADHRIKQPQFMIDLMDVEGEHGISYALAGDLFLEVRGTEILRDLKEW